MNDILEKIQAVQEECDIAYAGVVFAQCALSEKNGMIQEQYESESQDQIVQEFTLVELLCVMALVGATISTAVKLSRMKNLSKFERHTADIIADMAKIAQSSNGETDPNKAIENFRKLKKLIGKLSKITNKVRESGITREKYYAEEIKEIAKLAELGNTILDESSITKKRAKKSGNTDVFKVQLDGIFKQANTVLEIIERAAKKRKSTADLPDEDGESPEAPETAEAETTEVSATEESED